jgi:anti-sigma factor (TIGR02949 family)
MKSCADVESAFAKYVDGEVQGAEAAEIARHLDACPSCRTDVERERVARALVRERRGSLCCQAPAHLRSRCAGSAKRTSAVARWVPLSAAAALLLAIVGVFVYGAFDRGAQALATQLALDHVKCFGVFQPDGLTDPQELGGTWQRTQGWQLTVPPPRGDLELLGVRRCLSSQGRIAHIMYRHAGRPLSLFVARDEGRRPRTLDALGYQAILWSEGDRVFVLVGQEPRAELEEVAAYVQARTGRRRE